MRVDGAQAGEPAARVLVVDDDAATRDTLAALLDDEFTVETAGDGDTAAALLEARDFDVLITDYEMPALSGIDLLALAARRRPCIVGLLVTGHADGAAVRVAIHMRGDDLACDLIAKPYDPGELVAQVRAAASRARRRRAAAVAPG
jgi:DNA-binding NtrC family response regulator